MKTSWTPGNHEHE